MKFAVSVPALAIGLAASTAFAQQTPSQQPPGQNQPVQQTPGQATPSGQNVPLERRAIPPDEVPRGETVMGRPRPDYDPLGIRMGGFLLFPSLAVRQLYTSNVYATDKNTIDDFVTILEPSVDLRSDWNNHSLTFHADAAIGRYWDETTEDYEDFNVAAAGRLDVTRDTQIFAGLGYRWLHEERSSPDEVGGREPTEYSLMSANLGVQQRFTRLVFRVDGLFDRYDFRDVPAFGGGKIDQDDRDRDEMVLRLRGGYEFTPLRELYFQASINKRHYDRARDSAGLERDSDGFEIGAGLRYDLSGVTFIDFFLGYSEQNYEDSSLKTAKGLSGALSLIWNVTRLTTVTGKLSREIEETTQNGASAYFATRGEVRVDHELLRNFILTGFVAYQQDDYKGIKRDDDFYALGLSGRYLFNRNFAAEAGYTFRARDSNLANSDYEENLIMVRLIGRM
jgi:hypothetical protein